MARCYTGSMTAQELLPWLLLAQGVMGGFDTLFNHELVEHLPRRPEARPEIGLHSMREAIWALLLAGLGWLEWHGAWALALALVVAAEIAVTALDEWTENRIRVLPQNERVLHVFLTLNLGLIVAALVSTLPHWHARPTALIVDYKGWISWALLALGASAGIWSLRDLVAWRKLSASARRP
jgi:uncharacterized protein